MNLKEYTNNYFLKIKECIDSVDIDKLEKVVNLIKKTNNSGNKIIILGNGGSASIASHLTVDFVNAAKINAVNFNEPSLLKL